MSEVFKIVLTSALTVLGGIAIIVAGQVSTKFFIEPIHEHRRIIGEIAESLLFYAYLYSNPGIGRPEEMNEAQKVFRQQASRLVATSYAIQWRKLPRFLSISIPGPLDVTEARGCLIGLSNSIHESGDPRQNREWVEEIRKRLGIETATSSAEG